MNITHSKQSGSVSSAFLKLYLDTDKRIFTKKCTWLLCYANGYCF